MDQTVEKRRHPRQEFFSAIVITPNGDQHDAQLLDVSAGGARVILPGHWTPSDGAALRMFFLIDSDHAIALQAHVTRVAVDHLGVQFAPAQEEGIRLLLDVVGKRH